MRKLSINFTNTIMSIRTALERVIERDDLIER
jgi:hypothetical protein